jgi:thiamine transport system permease protein
MRMRVGRTATGRDATGRSAAPGGERLVSSLALLAYAAAALAPLAAILILAPPASGAAGGSATGGGGLIQTLLQPRSLRAIGFTLAQAGISTLAALAIGLPGAALVARYKFPGRRALKSLSILPFSVPSVLVVLAFVLFYGRGGYLNHFLMWAFALREAPIGFLYSFWGIILVHGFYEFPIVLQTVGEVWERLPRDRERAARLLGAGRLRAFATGVLPSLAPAIAQAAALCFLLCFFSFAVVMVFGSLAGSTMEVEVYRRARMEADPAGAASIALAETAIALCVVALVALLERLGRKGGAMAKAAGSRLELARPRGAASAAIAAYALFLAVFFGGPMLSLLAQAFTVRSGLAGPAAFGLGNFARLFSGPGHPFVAALAATAATALPAALAATLAGCAGALALRRGGALAKAVASLPIAVSGIVAALGWSLLFPRGGIALIPLVQAFCALPYVLKSVTAALDTLDLGPTEAARCLGASRARAAFGVELPAVLPAILAAFAFSFASAAGDVNVPMALSRGSFETLPVYLFRLTSAYRLPEACAAGVVLALLVSAVFAAKERRASDARG